jgi:cell division protease FtsH
MKAKQLKELGPPEDVEYIERERHAVAVHEACHAVVAYRTRQHLEIDIATIEKGSDYLGMVASIKPEDQFTRWRSEYESATSSSRPRVAGRGADVLRRQATARPASPATWSPATTVASFMEGYWGMGSPPEEREKCASAPHTVGVPSPDEPLVPQAAVRACRSSNSTSGRGSTRVRGPGHQ